jgi:4-amino-4-deoxy-L-arabinose transferase-like glycosyltransferase
MTGVAYWAAMRGGRTVHWVLLGLGVGMALWAKYFVVVQAIPLMLFALFDRDARKRLRTPGPWLAIFVAMAVMAPHLIWLVQNDFLPFGYAEARAVQFKKATDYLVKPVGFLLSQLGFLLPSLLIAAPYLRRDVRAPETVEKSELEMLATEFDRRVVTLLAFGPAVMLVLLSLLTGRDAVALWGYPLWLFLGLWIVLNARLLERVTLWRIVFLWGVIFIGTAITFMIRYEVSQRFKPHYSAVLYPGDNLGAEMSRRFREHTGRPLAYVIGPMWEAGNIAHYAPEHPRVLIDGAPRRAPWIDLNDVRARGAIVVWPVGNTETDKSAEMLPVPYRAVANGAQIQFSLTLPMHLGADSRRIGWAVLRPQPPTP